VPNEDGSLRANQFAQGVIEAGPTHTAFTVPRDAIQRVGGRELVFVRAEVGVYEPRGVQRVAQPRPRPGGGHPSRERSAGTAGADDRADSDAREDRVMVAGDLRDGDAVVTTGAFLLRTELLPGAIGAGCCEVSPGGGG
jgi:cobalt-zinc-cadmium efflux system membrane fusion protein